MLLSLLNGCGGGKNNSNQDYPIVEVAILLPLFSEDSKLYRELNTLIKMGIADGAKTKFKVTSYDASNTMVMEESLEKIINQNTNIVIGPVFSEATEAAINKLKGKDIVIITLSNNPVLADKDVFVFGHAPMKQQEFLLDQLLSHKYNNFIAMLPAGRHSKNISSIFQNMINDRKANMVKVEYYNNNEEDIARAARVVSETVDSLNEMDENITQPVVMLADDSYTLQAVFKYLNEYKLDKKSLIVGDSRINISAPENLDFLFSGSANINNNPLISRAGKLGIYHLNFMHHLAYDAGKMVSDTIGMGYDYQSFVEALKSTTFDGISGRISFVDSIAQRKYVAVKKTNGALREFFQKPMISDDPTLQNQVKQIEMKNSQ